VVVGDSIAIQAFAGVVTPARRAYSAREQEPAMTQVQTSPTHIAAATLVDRYRRARGFTEAICEPLQTEDYVIQTMPDVSPAKWHLGHTSWFFERFVLQERPGSPAQYEPMNGAYHFLFNSYYNAVGPMHCRASRGLLSRPTVQEVYTYRRHVDEHVVTLLSSLDDDDAARIAFVIDLGLHHEQQHQELMVADLKHVFASNPLLPAYREAERERAESAAVDAMRWVEFPGGVCEIGCDADPGRSFCYDNETPRHKAYVAPFALASRPVACGEFLRFIADGGYTRPELWLSLGWQTVQAQRWTHPVYWWREDGESGRWMQYTLAGPRPVGEAEPLCHLSYFEADAFARWAGARLPTEQEWETAAAGVAIDGGFAESMRFHPRLESRGVENAQPALQGMFGCVWQWTSSAYAAYPGYRPWAGAIGEYNGKFMCNQYVLRGGSCATPRSHIRPTYRNFFPPEARWQFTGLRLARDGE
jgi:ergothioneine biosynthesis protein EgtB